MWGIMLAHHPPHPTQNNTGTQGVPFHVAQMQHHALACRVTHTQCMLAHIHMLHMHMHIHIMLQ